MSAEGDGGDSDGLGLPQSIWNRVAFYLHTNDLLGRLAFLSAGHAALLADEQFWGTMALPAGRARLDHLFWLMLVEERELWMPLLHQVQYLDLDLQYSTTRTVGLFRDLLLHGVSVEGALRSIRVRRLPISAALDPGAEAPTTKFTKTDLALVNPVPRNPNNDRRLFLLDPKEFARLRLLMVGFRYLRLCPSAQCLEPSVDLIAFRDMPQGVSAVVDSGCDGDIAEAIIMAELGALRDLPPNSFGGGAPGSNGFDFDSWLGMIRPRYQFLLSTWV
eukprot:CAMPEP_0204585330 /NCGR_PEP_ID=MMETSP0661-20131031/46853_1 /ASSEMBLY_ACC=CAM_ASM_000606 /TAXON_ID=109239 /ORGANISM="Alexandrium margalefi, Strain AMGDE01CS-322" /LENGTH=274 /DNA_ID=CAMNT_0051594869 /DNA_START=74 /DNA_END=898 /DNA_ORIENTATION=+